MHLTTRIADLLSHAVRMTDLQPFVLAPCPALLVAGDYGASTAPVGSAHRQFPARLAGAIKG